MQKQIRVITIVLAALLVIGSSARAQSADPWIGTWKLNLAKSTYSPGPKPTTAGTVKIETTAAGMKTTIDGTTAAGQPTHTEAVGNFDSKDNAVKGAPAPNTTTALKRLDARSFEATNKIDGKTVAITRVAISADGKTLTATQTGKNPQGQSINNVIVADKQ